MPVSENFGSRTPGGIVFIIKTYNMGTAAKKPRAKRSVRSGRKKMEIYKKNLEILKKYLVKDKS
jgi:hypothetical protein